MLTRSHHNYLIMALVLFATVVLHSFTGFTGVNANKVVAGQLAIDPSGDSPNSVATIAEQEDCKVTTIGPKCGTPLMLAPRICNPGQPTCFALIWEYESLRTCQLAKGGGRTTCEDAVCHKMVIKQACVGNVCCVEGEITLSPSLTGSRAGGLVCGNPTTTFDATAFGGIPKAGAFTP